MDHHHRRRRRGREPWHRRTWRDLDELLPQARSSMHVLHYFNNNHLQAEKHGVAYQRSMDLLARRSVLMHYFPPRPIILRPLGWKDAASTARTCMKNMRRSLALDVLCCMSDNGIHDSNHTGIIHQRSITTLVSPRRALCHSRHRLLALVTPSMPRYTRACMNSSS